MAQVTAIGSRQSNQDALGAAEQDDLACFVVSDGTGGHEGGEVASNIVVSAIIERFLKESSFGTRALRSYIDYAIKQVARGKMMVQRQNDMSATVAAVLIDQRNRCVVWAHMGDTRIYLFRENKIKGCTKDHSLAQRMIEAGYGRADQLRQHPQRSVLFAAIGAEGDMLPDVVDQAIEIRDGDAFLICTDGFWEWVKETDMERTLAAARTADEWLNTMNYIADQNLSAARKPRDNYSAFIIWMREASGRPAAK